jgi:hypothetical protein
LGDFNIQLNDSYEGKMTKGCPAVDEKDAQLLIKGFIEKPSRRCILL